MFVPVTCTSCGKPFQVPETALGKLAPCPWCQAIVNALPVSVPVTRASPTPPASAPAPQEPLSLDDEEPALVSGTEEVNQEGVAGGGSPHSGASGGNLAGKRSLVSIFLVLMLMVVATSGTLLYRNYGAGRMSSSGWTEFTPPDGSFTVALPDAPTETPVDANPAGSILGGKRYSVRGWYSKTDVWVAYNDLDPNLAQKISADRDQALADGALDAERDREKARLGGTVTTKAPFRLGAWWGVELHMDTPRGKAIERLILVGNTTHPRVYVLGAEAKNLTPQSPVCMRLNGTFRLND